MAKLLPNGLLSGSVGGLTYAPQPNGEVVVREKPVVSRERILNNERSARTRDNFREFRRAIRGGMLVRRAFKQLIKVHALADRKLSGRLHACLNSVLKKDPVHGRGERIVFDGQVDLLTDFAFKKDLPFDSVFNAGLHSHIDLISGRIRVEIESFLPQACITAPEGATHFRLLLQTAAIHFDDEKQTSEYSSTVLLSLQDAILQPLVLAGSLQAMPGCCLLSAIGIEFYVMQANGQLLTVPGGVMKVVEVAKVAAVPDAVNKQATQATTAGAFCDGSSPPSVKPAVANAYCAPCQLPDWISVYTIDSAPTDTRVNMKELKETPLPPLITQESVAGNEARPSLPALPPVPARRKRIPGNSLRTRRNKPVNQSGRHLWAVSHTEEAVDGIGEQMPEEPDG